LNQLSLEYGKSGNLRSFHTKSRERARNKPDYTGSYAGGKLCRIKKSLSARLLSNIIHKETNEKLNLMNHYTFKKLDTSNGKIVSS
jgi:hypothetical protein